VPPRGWGARAPEVGEAGQEGVPAGLDAVGAHLRPGRRQNVRELRPDRERWGVG